MTTEPDIARQALARAPVARFLTSYRGDRNDAKRLQEAASVAGADLTDDEAAAVARYLEAHPGEHFGRWVE